jgi:hypothetical protein
MKKETYDLEIDWWFPFFIFSPSMFLFMGSSWYFWNEPLTVIPVMIIFSFASVNFIYGYSRMFLAKVILQDDVLIYDYFFIQLKTTLSPLTNIQYVSRFSPLGSMTLRQIALIRGTKIVYVNDIVQFERFRQRVLIDYGGKKKL